jgi:hypothetical protein
VRQQRGERHRASGWVLIRGSFLAHRGFGCYVRGGLPRFCGGGGA